VSAMRRLCAALLLGACAITAAVENAAAATTFTFVGQAVSGTLETDPRYAAFQTSDGGVTLIEWRTGRTSRHAPPRQRTGRDAVRIADPGLSSRG
jgi:hypothetical protein